MGEEYCSCLNDKNTEVFAGKKKKYRGEYVDIKREDKREVSAEYVRKLFLIFTVPNGYY